MIRPFNSAAALVSFQQERTAMKPIILATCLTATLVIPAAASERIAFFARRQADGGGMG